MSIILVQSLNTGVSAMVPFGSSSLPATPLFITTDDTVAEVTASGYLSEASKQFVIPIADKQAAWVYTTDGGMSLYQVSVSGSTVSLVAAEGSVTPPVVSGNFAIFDGTTGALEDAGYSPTDATKTKVVMAAAATTIGLIPKFTDIVGTVGNGYTPSDATKTVAVMATAATTINKIPKFTDITGTVGDGYTPSDATKTVAVMANAATVIDELASFADITGTVKSTGIASNLVLRTNIATPDTNINLVSFDIAVTAAALAAGASVTLFASSGAKQYRIRSLWINAGGTNFSGGGGDRLLDITDNTTVYSSIPAATLGTLVNAGWGDGTDLPYPAAAAINQASAAGQAIVAKYSGGAADFSAGSVTISGVLERIA
jgi:hypothetical protein